MTQMAANTRDYDPNGCQHHARPIVLGATNLWFPITLTVLSIPSDVDKLAQLVEQSWDVLYAVEAVGDITYLRRRQQIQGEIADYSDEQILAGIQAYQNRQSQSEPAPDIKLPEWEVFWIRHSIVMTSEPVESDSRQTGKTCISRMSF